MKRFRAMGIEETWKKQGNFAKQFNLENFIDYYYKQYRTTCIVCTEKPLNKAKWMLEYI